MVASPAWLPKLADAVIAHMRAVDILSPVGCHHFYDEAEQQWEITLFASRTEVVGGEYDGRWTFSKFGLDVLGLMKIFSKIDSCHWQAHSFGADDELGAHISIVGEFAGQRLWLRVLASAPERFESGRIADTAQQRLENTW
jgi:hypothetical protein